MSRTYFPGADAKTQNFAARYPGSKTSPNVIVLHSTEGTGWPGYNGGATAPHFTIKPDFANKRVIVRQHYPVNMSARALENRAGGVQTNTLNAVQIEMIGTCDPTAHRKWGTPHIYMPEAPDWFVEGVADVVRWLHAEWPGFPVKDGAPRGWRAYPSSYGNARGQRLSFTEWSNTYGIVGHQHVPENSHGDPGNFPIARLVEFAKGSEPVVPVVPKPVEPKPVPVSKTATFNGGYGNIFGGYTKTDKGWYGARAKAQAAKVRAMKVSWFVALECHEENGMHRYFAGLLGGNFALAEGKGGNHLFYDRTKYKILSSKNLLMPGNRWMTKWNVEHTATGVKFWIIGAHFIAGATKASARNSQGKFIVEQTKTIARGIIAIDRNNATAYLGSPLDRLRKAGWLGLRDKVKNVVNAHVNSHQAAKDKGQWIDDFHTQRLVSVLSGELVKTGSLSDHNWLKAQFSITA